MEKLRQPPIPHVLIFPLPLQGHVNTMLKLAELISLAGLRVTFLNSDYNHQRLIQFTNVQARFARFPGFQFQTISDGLPLDHPRCSALYINDLFDSIQAVTKPLFRQLLITSTARTRGSKRTASSPIPVTCIIADGIMSFTVDIAQELGIPIIAFRTISACCFWIYFCLPKLIEAGELPFSDDDDDDYLDQNITNCIPGMENLVRRRDLPSFCRTRDLSNPVLQRVIKDTLYTTRASALILNTFEHLEGPILSEIRNHCPRLYTLGPLHALLLKSSHYSKGDESSSNSLWAEDRSCMTWLDSQPLKSVVYVSFGSLTVMTREEMLEFWHGLIESGKPFLWVIRPDCITRKESPEEDEEVSVELREGTRERGFMVEWAPQEEVLAHPAVGGFLTHSGWNSTLESIYAGVPMICWPYFADQQVNSRFVSKVWRNGLDMKDSCDRKTVANMMRHLLNMEEIGEELRQSADKIAQEARRAVRSESSQSEDEGEGGGSSYSNLTKLIHDIRTNNLAQMA